jgi:hypothetical protein
MQSALIFLFVAAASAGVEAPVVGCFVEAGEARQVVGVADQEVAADAESCAEVPNAWAIETEPDGSWLLKRDPASGAVEHREKLRDGHFLVWPDGRLTDVSQLDLPGDLKLARLLSATWFRLVLNDGTQLALARSGSWFFLPGVSR